MDQATTYDGLPISPAAPFGATVIVYRRTLRGLASVARWFGGGES